MARSTSANLTRDSGQHHLKVVTLGAIQGSEPARVHGCSCGALCPYYLNAVSLPRSDDDWFNDHLEAVANL
jgi:hypothetical protein